MADEASDTLGGGVRNFLGALGFISALIGGEEIWRVGPTWPGVTLVAISLPIFISPWIWNKLALSRTRSKPQTLEYLHHKDSGLGSAIVTMALRSAWGRWYAAQHLVDSGNAIDEMHLLQIAGSVVMDKILDGDLEVRGRRPEELGKLLSFVVVGRREHDRGLHGLFE
jgi:hypothetical protein